MFRTHTLPQEGGEIKIRADKMKMRMKEMEIRWEWKWDESYLARTRRGEHKRRGKEQTPTQTHLAQSWQTLKGQGKKTRSRRKRNQTSGGGGRRKPLNQPTKAEPKPT